MIFWKEWRETRFPFLLCLFFVTGLYYSIPTKRTLTDEFWIGVFLHFFGIAFAVVMGSGAFSSEAGGRTLGFLMSMPVEKGKVLAAKYCVRGTETALIFLAPIIALILSDTSIPTFATQILNVFYPPIVAHPWFSPHWDPSLQMMWVPPHLAAQYISIAFMVIIFIFSGSFLISVLLPKKRVAVLGGVIFFAAFFSFRGMAILQKVNRADQVKGDIVLLLALSAAAFFVSVFLAQSKDY